LVFSVIGFISARKISVTSVNLVYFPSITMEN
jgi:hypothetical protein